MNASLMKLLRPCWLILVLLSLFSAGSLFAQNNTEIDTDAVLHDSRDSLYRTPGGAVPFNSSIKLRLRAASGDIDSASVRVYRTYNQSETLLPMQVVASTPEGYDYWEAALDVGSKPTLYYYRFLVTKGGETLYYEDDTRPNAFDYLEANKGGIGTVYEQSPDLSYQISVYDPSFYTPEWMRNAVIYQIFPDRFRNGDLSNDPSDGSDVFYGELPLLYHETWNEPPVDGRVTQAPSGAGYYNSDFYGGDLQGVIDKLDYLQELGVTAIYLNPIFEARSNHRYDTADYTKIDPMLGDLETFQNLVTEAQARRMQIILDGVFNHMSSDSVNFDRYHRFSAEGACESLDSPYRAWFSFLAPRDNQPSPCVETPDHATYYASWAGFDSIPRLNSPSIDVRRFIYLNDDSVARQWEREGIGGWRLDVANEIDNGQDPADLYWETFRTVVRSENPETVIIGEYWNDASEWLLGDEWDSTMNYRFRRAIVGFARDSSFVDNDGTFPALSPTEFDGAVRAVEEDYPPMAYHAMMNVLDSHDTSRLLFQVDNETGRQKLAALAQFTLPGAPTVYYGDEVAIDAPSIPDAGNNLQDDPFNRAPYPWPDTEGNHYPPPDDDMLGFYQQISALRHANPALREGTMTTLLTDDANGIYAFLRIDAASGNAAVVILNNGDEAQTVSLDWSGLLPTGLTLTPLFDADPILTDSGSGSVMLDANSGNIWTATAGDNPFSPLPAPTNLSASADNGSVTLTWDTVDDTAGYAVYRSPVADGGFVLVTATPVEGTTYEDNTVTNGFQYYYTVAPISEAAVTGTQSASVGAVPSAQIYEAFYVNAAGETRLELVFGVTFDLEAGVRVDGLTNAEGQAQGILAQAALVPADQPLDSAAWQPMDYIRDEADADIYMATIAPQETGDFNLVARFSTDAGANWTTVTEPDGSFPVLVLEASADAVPPDAPAALEIVRASLSGVVLGWQPVEDDNLFAYRIYRTDDDGTSTMLAEVPANGEPRYVDANVAQGGKYVYAVSAVDGSLNESTQTDSEQVTVQRQNIPVTFTVEVPTSTDSDVFIAGDFGTGDYPTWDPGGIVMEQVDDTHWSVVLNLPEGAAVEYKYVRGTWDGVEKGTECEEISNRRLAIVLADSETVSTSDEVANWRDIDCGG
jgi:glycosidase/fibronectin type 3 domain-containing protein